MMPERRELADRLLCKLVQQRRIPTLGIGLGMQELNVVAGGGLFVHLPEDMPKCIPHHDPHGGAHRHTVVMQPKTPARGDLRSRRDPRQQLPPPGHPQARPQLPGRRAGSRRPDRGVRRQGPGLVGRRRAVAPRERGPHLPRHAAHRGVRRGRRLVPEQPGAGQGRLSHARYQSPCCPLPPAHGNRCDGQGHYRLQDNLGPQLRHEL